MKNLFKNFLGIDTVKNNNSVSDDSSPDDLNKKIIRTDKDGNEYYLLSVKKDNKGGVYAWTQTIYSKPVARLSVGDIYSFKTHSHYNDRNERQILKSYGYDKQQKFIYGGEDLYSYNPYKSILPGSDLEIIQRFVFTAAGLRSPGADNNNEVDSKYLKNRAYDYKEYLCTNLSGNKYYLLFSEKDTEGGIHVLWEIALEKPGLNCDGYNFSSIYYYYYYNCHDQCHLISLQSYNNSGELIESIDNSREVIASIIPPYKDRPWENVTPGSSHDFIRNYASLRFDMLYEN